jgi:hypothetical protein
MTEIHYEVGRDGLPKPDEYDRPRSVPPRSLELPEIGYKPGWTFWWDIGRSLWLNCRIRPPELKAIDSGTGSDRPISWSWEATYAVDVDWVWEKISGIEYHLRGEWFSVDGAKPYDPHREGSAYPFKTMAVR